MWHFCYSSVDLTVVTAVFCVIGWTSDWIINKSNPFTWIRNWRLLNTFKMYEVHSYCLRYNFRDAYLCPEVVVGGHILIIQVTKRVEFKKKLNSTFITLRALTFCFSTRWRHPHWSWGSAGEERSVSTHCCLSAILQDVVTAHLTHSFINMYGQFFHPHTSLICFL